MNTRHDPLPPATLRRGISLLEVLISIGIMSVGLIAALSLIPVGRTYLAKAVVDDQAAVAVSAAYETLNTAGLISQSSLPPLNSFTGRVVAVDPLPATRLDRALDADPTNATLIQARQHLAAFAQLNPDGSEQPFQIPRITWLATGNLAQRVALADRLCRIHDDLEVDDNVVNTGSGKRDEFAPPRPVYANGPIGTTGQDGPLARQSLGRMSWMVLLQPQGPGGVDVNWAAGSIFDASIVIFRDRPLRTLDGPTPAVTGEYVFPTASWDPIQGLLSITVPQPLNVHGQNIYLEDEDLRFIFRTGGWILLAPKDADTGQPQDNRQKLVWVRVQSAEIGRSEDGPVVTVLPETEPVELTGGTAATAPVPLVALVYEGVVAVATKQITP